MQNTSMAIIHKKSYIFCIFLSLGKLFTSYCKKSLRDPRREIMFYFSICFIFSLSVSPTDLFVILPFLNTISVGMLLMQNFAASAGCSSIFTLPTVMSGVSSAISAMMGDSIVQGIHQSAQKSTRTVLLFWVTFCSKFSAVSVISLIKFLLRFCRLAAGGISPKGSSADMPDCYYFN